MSKTVSIVWFRRDLRIADNPALFAAHAGGGPVIGLYVFDDTAVLAPGAAQLQFLRSALLSLGEDLRALGTPLLLRQGAEAETLASVVREAGAGSVYWNRRYAAEEIRTDQSIKAALNGAGVETQSYGGSLLREPWEIRTKSGGPYRVFTPFWNAVRAAGPSRREIAAPFQRQEKAECVHAAEKFADGSLFPKATAWAAEIGAHWTASEDGARKALDAFLGGGARRYARERDRPDIQGTSRLSPHLALGTISPLTVWNETNRAIAEGAVSEADGWKFLSEIAWREFSYHLLYHNPALSTAPLREEFRSFPWREDEEGFRAWTRGATGVPIVDAGMRELWRTGWMHNRVRMIAASFLVKNLLIDWRRGERWFWDTLVDADPANNPASWQWVAGCGADAAPWFRIFNPVAQGEKFDSDGAYVRKFVPEIAALPNKSVHAPWRADEAALSAAGVRLGVDYPHPIVDLGQSRKRALAAYNQLKGDAAPLAPPASVL